MLKNYFHTDSFLYDVLVWGRKIENEEQAREFEASYMAMIMLLPDESFKQEIIKEGGLYSVQHDISKLQKISKRFNVSKKLIECKIKSIIIKNNLTKGLAIVYNNKEGMYFATGKHIVAFDNNCSIPSNPYYKLIRVDGDKKIFVNTSPIFVESKYYLEDANHFGKLFISLDNGETFYDINEHKLQFDSLDEFLKEKNHKNYDLDLSSNNQCNSYTNSIPVVSHNNMCGITLEENAKLKLHRYVK